MQKNDEKNEKDRKTEAAKAPAAAAQAPQKKEGAPAEKPAAPEKAAAALEKEIGALKQKLSAAEKEMERQKDLLLRTAAEYDNYRKRTAREKESAYTDATSDAVQEFLPVADNLERALEQKDCPAEDLRKGVEMVLRQMQDALKKLGVAEMGKEGEPFDPAVHSAVAHVEDKSLGENTVTKVFRKGYRIGGKVVRHAMVQVAN